MHFRNFDPTRPAKSALTLTRDPTRPDPRVDPTRVHLCLYHTLGNEANIIIYLVPCRLSSDHKIYYLE